MTVPKSSRTSPLWIVLFRYKQFDVLSPSTPPAASSAISPVPDLIRDLFVVVLQLAFKPGRCVARGLDGNAHWVLSLPCEFRKPLERERRARRENPLQVEQVGDELSRKLGDRSSGGVTAAESGDRLELLERLVVDKLPVQQQLQTFVRDIAAARKPVQL